MESKVARQPRNTRPLTGNDGDLDRLAFLAPATGRLDALRSLLGQRPEWIRGVDPHGRTLLWEAGRKGKITTLEFLLHGGAEATVPGCYCSETFVELSPLAIPRACGRTAVVERLGVLLASGASPDVENAKGRSPMFLARRSKKAKAKEALEFLEAASTPDGSR